MPSDYTVSLTVQGQVIAVDTTTLAAGGGYREHIMRQVVNLQDEAVRKGLIQLGWVPPTRTQQDVTHDSIELAKLIASDCGCSTKNNDALVQRIAGRITAVTDALHKNLAHWKANHACEVQRARVLKERPDMPLERVRAYDQILDLREAFAAACAYIDADVGDPDVTPEMRRTYARFQQLRKAINGDQTA